ncbi:hypothetical protein HMPREF1869_01358, partial [Bacteroidales bacterium KA00251]
IVQTVDFCNSLSQEGRRSILWKKFREFLENVPRDFGKCSESFWKKLREGRYDRFLAFWSILCDFRKMFLYALGGGKNMLY